MECILNCPCCGSKDVQLLTVKEMIFKVKCNSCGVNTDYFCSKKKAIDCWNTRQNGRENER